MSFIDDIKVRARKNIKTIVLPEAEDRRVLEAAATTLKEGNAKAVLLGDPADIAELTFPAQRSSTPRPLRSFRLMLTSLLSFVRQRA